MKYATGRFAWAICDRCGTRGKSSEMAIEPGTGLFVHPNHMFRDGRLRPRHIEPDAVALRNPRPDVQQLTNTVQTFDNTYLTFDSDQLTWDGI